MVLEEILGWYKNQKQKVYLLKEAWDIYGKACDYQTGPLSDLEMKRVFSNPYLQKHRPDIVYKQSCKEIRQK